MEKNPVPTPHLMEPDSRHNAWYLNKTPTTLHEMYDLYAVHEWQDVPHSNTQRLMELRAVLLAQHHISKALLHILSTEWKAKVFVQPTTNQV